MRALTVTLLLLIAACGGSTGPAGLDPTVLVTNVAGPDTLHLTWFDQSGQVATFLVAPGATSCTHFTATRLADSVRFVAVMGDTTSPSATWSKQWSPWFDPQTGVGPDPTQYPVGAEYWTLTISQPWALLMKSVQAAPC